jgi:hypothetical protein
VARLAWVRRAQVVARGAGGVARVARASRAPGAARGAGKRDIRSSQPQSRTERPRGEELEELSPRGPPPEHQRSPGRDVHGWIVNGYT